LEGQIGEINPLWKDTDSNTINRFAFFAIEFGSPTRPVYSGEIQIGDNENFMMEYNYTNYTLQHVVSNAYDYGTYFWQCDKPTNYTFVSNSSGYIDINEPMETITLVLQKVIPLNLKVQLTKQSSPVVGAICLSDTGAMDVTGTDGICYFEELSEESEVGVNVTYQGIQRSATFPIGDYYNSEGYGEGDICADFQDTGDYIYSWDIENDKIRLGLTALTISELNPVSSADVYMDGTLVGVTDSSGT